MEPDYLPQFKKNCFLCPHCQKITVQTWLYNNLDIRGNLDIHLKQEIKRRSEEITENLSDQKKFESTLESLANKYISFIKDYSFSRCETCQKSTVWLRGDEKQIYPLSLPVPSPNSDLPPNLQEDYLEAAKIFHQSPRASAALLRLALEKLSQELGRPNKSLKQNINHFINEKKLNSKLIQAFESVRIIGNNCVHPGKIVADEIPQTVIKMFDLINIIARQMISENKEISNLYEDMPDSQKKLTRSNEAPNSQDSISSEDQ